MKNLFWIFLLTACAGLNIVKDRLPPPHKVNGKILFQLYSESAKQVFIAGEFNNWEWKPENPRAIRMEKNPQGIWQTQIEIPSGRYQYKFVIDNTTWIIDPYNPYTIDDGKGNINSLLIVK